MAEKTEIRVSRIALFAGVSKSTWHEWQTRKGVGTKHNHDTPKLNWYTPAEKEAVVSYVLSHKNFLYGYRYLAWQMIDENVAFVRPVSIYNSERLHGSLLYLTSEDYFEGRKEERLAERSKKLHNADMKRKTYWLAQQA